MRCTHERCQDVGPCCSQTCVTREYRCTPDVVRSSSTYVQPAAHVSRRTDQHKMRQRTSNPRTLSRSPMARTTVSHISKKAFCKKRCIGTPSRTRRFGANVSPAQKHVLYNNNKDQHQRQRPERAAATTTKLTPSSRLPAFDTRMATDRARPPSVRHRARHAAMLRHFLRAHSGQSLRAQASMLAHRTRRRSATRRLDAMRRRL